MNLDAFKRRMMSDLDFAVSYIVRNNPDAVRANLLSAGFATAGTTDVEAALNEMFADGDIETFTAVLDVPMLTDQVPEAEVVAVQRVAEAFAANAPTKSFDIPGTDDVSDGGEVPADWDATGDSNAGSGFWNNFGSIITGLTTLYGTFNAGQSPEPGPSDPMTQAEAERLRLAGQRERMMWTGGLIALGLVVVAVVIYMTTRKGK